MQAESVRDRFKQSLTPSRARMNPHLVQDREELSRMDWVPDGTRSCPAFNWRLARAFGRNRLRMVWSDRFCCWIIYERGVVSGKWIETCRWDRDPTEEVIVMLKEGEFGTQGIPNVKEHVDRIIEAHEFRRAYLRQKRLEAIHDASVDAQKYLGLSLSDEYLRSGGRELPVINPLYTHGWRPE